MGDVGFAIDLLSLGTGLSAQFGYGIRFGEDYQSSDASLGVRFRW